MGKLLSGECFDSFLLEEASITTAVAWELNGRLNRDFYTEEEWNDKTVRPWEMVPWSEVRPLCRELIKGRRAPVRFCLVLHLKPEYIAATLTAGSGAGPSAGSVSSLVLTIRYDGQEADILTGVGHSAFTLDKSEEGIWDRAVIRFLQEKEIDFDIPV
ncbi:MAG: DUF5721 family protein [Lachnospiraceae bacterium]|nr:DUF5721 family protein [Lachnospiraceae bacterium]